MIRYDAEEVLQELRGMGVDRLYHVTDRENWQSIKKYGLLSLDYLRERGVNPQKSCGDRISRARIQRQGMGNLVHLALRKDPICLEQAVQAERIVDPIVIEISLDVFRDEDTSISPTDALEAKSKGVPFVSSLADIRSFVQENRQNGGISSDARLSEVLVKGTVPPAFFLNATELDRSQTSRNTKQAVLFILDQTESMDESMSLQGRFYASSAHAARAVVNDAINDFLQYCIGANDVSDSYEIALLSMSYQVSSAWSTDVEESFVGCKSLYREMILRLPLDGSRTRWVADKEPAGNCRPGTAIREAVSWARDWMFHHWDCPPPIIVFVTNGKSLQDSLVEIQKEAEILKNDRIFLLCYGLYPDKNVFYEFPTNRERGELGNLSPGMVSLYDISSVLNGRSADLIRERTGRMGDEFRAMCVNGSLIQTLRKMLP